MEYGKVFGVGVGPGDPELLTLKAINTIKKCKYIACPKSGTGENVALNIVKAAINIKDKKIIELDFPMTRNKDILEKSHDEGSRVLIDIIKTGEDVAFLTLGDPSIYSTYIYIHNRILNSGYESQLIPGIPSFCAVAARLNEGLVEGGEALHIIPASYNEADKALDLSGCKVLMKSGKSLRKVIDSLNHKGICTKAKVIERCGMDKEKVYNNVNDIEEDLSYFSIVVIKE